MTILESTTTFSPADLMGLLERQRRAFLHEGPPSADVRRERLDRLLVAVLRAAEDIVAALDDDFGHRPEAFSLSADVVGVISNVQHLSDHLDEWMATTQVAGSEAAGLPTTVEVAPLGIVGVVGPWNFPVGLVVQPAAEAIAAGNRVMIKFTDIDTRAGEVLARAIAEEFDPTELVVVNGGIDSATAFSSLPFDHLFFTGSPAVGKAVQRAAADNLTPVTLELGGKNPVVLGKDADLSEAAVRIAASRLINGGQVCLCPDYVFVPTARKDEFVAALRSAFLDLYPDFATDTAVTSIVNERNFDRVIGLIADAEANGATAIRAVSESGTSPLADRVTRRIAPTVLTGVTETMKITQDEIFGPVIAVYGYDALDEAIDYIAAHPSPLVAYWYGDDTADFRRFVSRTRSGGVTRNDFAVHLMLPDVPFGGVGQSGMGTYHGKAGFDTFSHYRAVAASLIPGGLARAMGPEALNNPAMAAGIREQIAQALEDALGRLGRDAQ